MKSALLAGTHSGCGKTTVMLALLQYFKKRKRKIAAFKTGPDFLDPLWHRAITGSSSYNLDTQMIGVNLSRQILTEQAKWADWALIEGAMGLFDGRRGFGEAGSAADLANGLRVPVILVVDASGVSASIVALVGGFCDYAKRINVKIAGVIANQVGGAGHADMLRDFLSQYGLPPLLAWMTRTAPALSERHLGLIQPVDGNVPDFLNALHIDDARFEKSFTEDSVGSTDSTSIRNLLSGKTIAIAQDAACSFIYPANLDWFRFQGAEIAFFSPLAGEPVPDSADALWLPGGYPELYARQLAHSVSWPSIRQFIEDRKPVLAECGGAMLLGEELIDRNGERWPMANALPFVSRMQDSLAALGYREEISGVRGHEFHYSRRESEQEFVAAFDCLQGDRGIRYRNLRASYIHWYFNSAPEVAAGWFS